jgi:hypothetical protein
MRFQTEIEAMVRGTDIDPWAASALATVYNIIVNLEIDID